MPPTILPLRETALQRARRDEKLDNRLSLL